MATKATIADVKNEGFTAAMFGGGTTFDTPGGIIDKLLERAENWVKEKVTAANFAAAVDGTFVNDCLIDAEKYFVSYQLWLRRIANIDSALTAGLEADKKAALLASMRTSAEQSQCDANYWLAEAQRAFGMDVQAEQFGTGISTGMVETGPWPQVIPDALNHGAAQ